MDTPRLRSALDQRDVYVRIGSENETPALRSLSLVAAGYGLPARNLGTVSVLGPLRMDYGRAIASVRAMNSGTVTTCQLQKRTHITWGLALMM